MAQSTLAKGPDQSLLQASSNRPSIISQHPQNPVVQYIIAPISQNIFK
ncbi:hypothetical protein EYZ11_008709 [Aspergillus tanneri]|uniref:Uncharacterized protein n=1 Tax=Aspergillus tanneri TaxID=1220188 RepID=A0A4S3J9T6_9EURO|nr:hypothetical protein EYZ11_008709 [Aspergillus tanneri]